MRKLVTLLIVLAAAGGGAYYYFVYGKVQEKPQVVKTTISQGDITEAVTTTGTLEALRTVQVGPQVSGTIQSLEGVDFNSIVHKGQVVARLDPSLLQVQVDIQQANIERQQTDIDSQKVQLLNDRKNLERTKDLLDKGLANQTQWETADLQVKTRMAQIASAEKQLVQAQANLAQAKLNVSYTSVTSPIDGVVVNRRVDIGQTVQSSMNITPFFDIATDLRQMKLTAAVDEAEIGKIQRGMDVEFTVDSFPQDRFSGTVDAVRLNASTNSNVVTYPVWINVTNDQLKLKPSMTANVRIIVSTARNVVRLPNTALRFRPTTDMYTALGLTPPAPAQGRAAAAGQLTPAELAAGNAATGGQGRRQQNAGAGNAAAGAPAAGAGGQQRQRGQGGQQAQAPEAPGAGGRGGQGFAGGQGAGRGQAPGGGQGFGNGGQGGGRGFGGQFANMTPEERAAMRARFGGAGPNGGAGGGRNGGQNAGGRTGGGRGAGAGQAARGGQGAAAPLVGDKIDDLFTPVRTRIQAANIWTWDEATKKLESKRVTYGVTDGTFSQLISGDVKVGDEVVTNIVLPLTSAQRSQQQSIFGGQQQNRGGFGPGGPGGPGGFGGGGGGGRGGGGRGGF
jgi:HlyD family secretion protein